MTEGYQQGLADRLAAAGRADDAHRLLEALMLRGEPAALFDLAVWRLRGREIGRDLAAARGLLRRAAAAGHADAAMLEVSLCATGAGAPPDFAAARRLLTEAARRDPLAAEHLDLLAAMAIDDHGRPHCSCAMQPLSRSPDIRLLRGFLREPERRHLLSTYGHQLHPSMVADPASGGLRRHPVRRSDAATIGPTRETLVVAAINRRIAAATATQIAQGEPLTVLRYRMGQEFRRHLDTLAGEANQRVWTVIVYLNDGFAGGRTVFDAASVVVEPRAGDALAFRTVLDDGTPDRRAIHAGLPVTRGEKWIATRWIRADPLDVWRA